MELRLCFPYLNEFSYAHLSPSVRGTLMEGAILALVSVSPVGLQEARTDLRGCKELEG